MKTAVKKGFDKARGGNDIPPAQVVAHAVHKETGAMLFLSAQEVDALRAKTPDWHHDYSFHCACCGPETELEHHITSKEIGKGNGVYRTSTHWALKDGHFHNEEHCDYFSRVERAKKLNNPSLAYHPDEPLVLRLERPPTISNTFVGSAANKKGSDGTQDNQLAEQDETVKSEKNTSKTVTTSPDVVDIDFLLRLADSLSPEEREKVEILDGRKRRSLADLIKFDMQHLVDDLDNGYPAEDRVRKSFLIPVRPLPQTRRMSANNPSLILFDCEIEEFVYNDHKYKAQITLVSASRGAMGIISRLPEKARIWVRPDFFNYLDPVGWAMYLEDDRKNGVSGNDTVKMQIVIKSPYDIAMASLPAPEQTPSIPEAEKPAQTPRKPANQDERQLSLF